MDQGHDGSAASSRTSVLSQDQLDAILQYDTCTIANAIECFGVRLRNEGFTRPGLGCVTGTDRRILGYAATFRVRTSEPPVTGGKFGDRTDWWNVIEGLPCPKIAVFQNVDADSGSGACVGEVHAAILKAFGCSGVVTDGSVRDIDGLVKLDFPVFAPSISVSHSYMHIVEIGAPVDILGLSVKQGDLIYADRYGVLAIPIEIAAQLPTVAACIRHNDRNIIKFCQSGDFSAEGLQQMIASNEQCIVKS